MSSAYRRTYYVAFDPDDNVITHSEDKFDCVKQAAEISDYVHVLPATRMNDEQFYNALKSINPDITFIHAVLFRFCGRLAFECNGFLFDQYGEPTKRLGSTDIRFDRTN